MRICSSNFMSCSFRERKKPQREDHPPRWKPRYVRIGLKGHRIRVSNTGGTTVTNVTCEYDENAGPYAFIQDKEPYERLEPGESFDETIFFADGSTSKFMVKTRWIGEDGKERSRDNIVSV